MADIPLSSAISRESGAVYNNQVIGGLHFVKDSEERLKINTGLLTIDGKTFVIETSTGTVYKFIGTRKQNKPENWEESNLFNGLDQSQYIIQIITSKINDLKLELLEEIRKIQSSGPMIPPKKTITISLYNGDEYITEVSFEDLESTDTKMLYDVLAYYTETPQKEGFVFKGWSLNQDSEDTLQNIHVFSESTEIYAVFEEIVPETPKIGYFTTSVSDLQTFADEADDEWWPEDFDYEKYFREKVLPTEMVNGKVKFVEDDISDTSVLKTVTFNDLDDDNLIFIVFPDEEMYKDLKFALSVVAFGIGPDAFPSFTVQKDLGSGLKNYLVYYKKDDTVLKANNGQKTIVFKK